MLFQLVPRRLSGVDSAGPSVHLLAARSAARGELLGFLDARGRAAPPRTDSVLNHFTLQLCGRGDAQIAEGLPGRGAAESRCVINSTARDARSPPPPTPPSPSESAPKTRRATWAARGGGDGSTEEASRRIRARVTRRMRSWRSRSLQEEAAELRWEGASVRSECDGARVPEVRSPV